MVRKRVTASGRLGIALLVVLNAFIFQPRPIQASTGTEGASFLELPVGARPAGLGSAYSMLAEDAYAPVWNPAGLAFVDGPQFAGMHMLYLEQTNYEFGSFVLPLGTSEGIGFAIQYFQPGVIRGLDANGNPIGDVNGSYANYTASFGQSFGKTLGVGVSGHLIRAQIDDASGQAFAGTGGILYRPNAKWRFAGVIANAGQKLTLIDTADSLPLTYRIGAAYHPTPPWTFALEGVRQNEDLNSAHVGIEYETPFGFTFRTGYNTERTRELSQTAGLSIGVSMLIHDQDFAYTWLPMSDLGSSHILSLVWHFGKGKRQAEDEHKLQRPPPDLDLDVNLEN